MTLSTYAKITYALGEMHFRTGEKLNLSDLMRFKFPEKINSEMAQKVVNLVNSNQDIRDLTALLPGAMSKAETPLLPQSTQSPTSRLGPEEEDNLPEEEPTRPR